MAEAIRYRNRQGEMVDSPQVSASEAKHRFGRLLDAAMRSGPVTITKQRKPQAVLISLEEYRALTRADEQILDRLTGEFDAMFERMQAPGAATAMQSAFDTPPRKLGEIAAAAAAQGARRAKAKRSRRD